MKTKNILFTTSLLAAGLLFSCSSDISDEIGVQEGSKTISKLVVTAQDWEDEGATTRLNYTIKDGAPDFNFQNGDTLGIFPTKGDQVNFPLVNPTGKSFEFNGGGWGLKSTFAYATYFPFSKANYYRSNKTIVMDFSGQVQNGLDNPAHLGPYDYMASGIQNPTEDYLSISLAHQACTMWLFVTISNPGTYTKAVISSNNQLFATQQTLNISQASPATTTKEQSNSIELGLTNFTTTTANQTVQLFLMAGAPVDLSASTLSITLFQDDGTSVTNTMAFVDANLNPLTDALVLKPQSRRRFKATL